jgi:hypothetical protein
LPIIPVSRAKGRPIPVDAARCSRFRSGIEYLRLRCR